MTLDARIRFRIGDLQLDLALCIAPGETVALLGPNGAGKTTALRLVTGLAPVDTGWIRVDGETLDDPAAGVFVPPERRPVGLLFQDYLLFPHLDALDNVAFGLRCNGVSRKDARREAAEWVERIGLADHAHHKPAALSGGQAQRVALARVLATGPRLLLLDEPLAALDAEARSEMRRTLRRSLGEFPGARLLVTHDPLDAATLADRVVVLEAGVVTQEGTLAEVAARPGSPYVAELVGVNLFDGTADGSIVRLRTGGEIHLPDACDGAVHVVIHPHSIALYRARPEGSPRNVWPGTIESIQALHGRARLQVTGPVPVVAEITPAALDEVGLAEGDDVWCVVKATDVVVYPA